MDHIEVNHIRRLSLILGECFDWGLGLWVCVLAGVNLVEFAISGTLTNADVLVKQ